MNTDHALVPLGPCVEHEFELVEYVDGALDAPARAAVDRHLEACGRCRAFVRAMSELTASLARALPRVEPSPTFDARLRARVAALGMRHPIDRAQAEQEYVGELRALRRGLAWSTSLNAVAMGSVCGGVITAALAVGPQLWQALGIAPPSFQATGLGLGVIALAAGIAASRAVVTRFSPTLAG